MGLFLLGLMACELRGLAQTIRIDVTPSHLVNTFSPPYALGTTVDRIPSNATDMFFAPDQVKQILEAGWGVVSYRQNTELFVQAWHWNPKGAWSDPLGKGYFRGDATPAELIRHSYGYSLQHRGFTRNGGTELDGCPVVQFDVKTKQKKVIAFLHPFYKDKYGAVLKGTFSSAVDPSGARLYITWNVSRGSKAWDCCALTVIHIPESERP